MGDQAEVAFNQDIFGIRITLLVFLKKDLFLMRGKRFLKSLQKRHLERDFLLYYEKGQSVVLFQEIRKNVF